MFKKLLYIRRALVPTIEQNKKAWKEKYEWGDAGNEWSEPWGSPDNQWFYSLLPRVHNYLNGTVGLEIAPGYGRWTQYLKDEFDELHLVDLAENCIAACKKRFSNSDNLHFHVNDGYTLPMIKSGSVDFVFSFDSLVHVEHDVIDSYLLEIERILTDGGSAFIHHSNLGGLAQSLKIQEFFTRGRGLLERVGVFENLRSGYRGKTVSGESVYQSAKKAKLSCISQEFINWHTKSCIDCISVFQKSSAPTEMSRINNPDFMKEAAYIKLIGCLYS